MYASVSRTYSLLQASALGVGLFTLGASGSFGSGGASDLTSLVNFCREALAAAPTVGIR